MRQYATAHLDGWGFCPRESFPSRREADMYTIAYKHFHGASAPVETIRLPRGCKVDRGGYLGVDWKQNRAGRAYHRLEASRTAWLTRWYARGFRWGDDANM